MAEKSTGLAALLLIGIVIAAVLGLGLLKLSAPRDITIPCFICWACFASFYKTVREPTSDQIRTAVKTGVLSLIVLDATLLCWFRRLALWIASLEPAADFNGSGTNVRCNLPPNRS